MGAERSGIKIAQRSRRRSGPMPYNDAMAAKPSFARAGRDPSVADVTLVRWPDEADRLERLRRDALPRLLLVAEGEAAPAGGDCEEDWIRLPAADADVRTRLVALQQRCARHARDRGPEIDLTGRVRFQGRWVALSRTEQRLARPLIEQTGVVVAHDTLRQSAWPDGDALHDSGLRVQILKLRRRLAPLDLAIRTVPGRGYVLEANTPDSASRALR
jgi:DNA-binding response OmpR family regulator